MPTRLIIAYSIFAGLALLTAVLIFRATSGARGRRRSQRREAKREDERRAERRTGKQG